MPYKRRFFSPKLTYLLLMLAGLAVDTSAQAATACVWRVTNVPVPFYLVGTVHALSAADYPLPKAYKQILQDSQRLLFEVDPDPKGDYVKKFCTAATYPKGDDIRRHIHAKTWEFLYKNFTVSSANNKSFWFGGHYVESFEKLQPWAIAYFIWGIRGYNDVFAEHGVDNHLSYQARRLRKETAGLESEDEHIDVLRGMSDVDSEVILLDTFIRGDKRRDDYNTVRAAWKKGDIATMWADEQRFRRLSPGADLRLLDERNVRWIPRIKAEMKSGKPTAIVVGSGHMPGPNGLIALLQRGGYTVEQL